MEDIMNKAKEIDQFQDESESNSLEESDQEESNESGLDKESKNQQMAICNELSEYKQY